MTLDQNTMEYLDSLEECLLPRPKMPKEKITQAHFDALYRHECRRLAIRLLRERYQLSFFECQGALPSVVQERQRLYTEHLNRLKYIWMREDRELEDVQHEDQGNKTS